MLSSSRAKAVILSMLQPRCQELVADVEAEIKAKAPVATGYLQSHIVGSMVVDGEEITMKWTSTAPYSLYVERGTSRQAPQAFMQPAFFNLERLLPQKLGVK